MNQGFSHDGYFRYQYSQMSLLIPAGSSGDCTRSYRWITSLFLGFYSVLLTQDLGWPALVSPSLEQVSVPCPCLKRRRRCCLFIWPSNMTSPLLTSENWEHKSQTSALTWRNDDPSWPSSGLAGSKSLAILPPSQSVKRSRMVHWK